MAKPSSLNFFELKIRSANLFVEKRAVGLGLHEPSVSLVWNFEIAISLTALELDLQRAGEMIVLTSPDRTGFKFYRSV